jgi:hypothetical protein
MKRLQLVFPSAAHAGDFLAANRLPHAEMTGSTIKGFFTESELATAMKEFGARAEDYVPTPEVAETVSPAAHHSATDTVGWEQDITLVGRSGIAYHGTLYTKDGNMAALPNHAIICLSNSTATNGVWHHDISAIYQTHNVAGELERFNHRDDLSHLIVIPIKPNDHNEVDKVDDLIRNYIHK